MAFNVVPLIDGYGARCTIAVDLKAQEPSDFTHIGNIDELADFTLEPLDRIWCAACNSHVICHNSNSCLLSR